MPSPDLIQTLERVTAMARDLDAGARKPDATWTYQCEAILAELSGAEPAYQWRAGVGPDAAAVICMAKAVRILASMLAGRDGVTISIAGILDDMAEAPADDPRNAWRFRSCLGCGVRFRSSGPAHRFCNPCHSSINDGDGDDASAPHWFDA